MNTTMTENTENIRNVPADGGAGLHLSDERKPGRTESRQRLDFTRLLDQLIPLRNVSHADVTAYTVETPMRYSECFATLADGAKAGLVNRRQFVGSRNNRFDQSLLFASRGMLVEISTGRSCGHAAVAAQSIAIRLPGEAANADRRSRSYIAVDGSLIDR